jgi:hypothetical protein
MFIVNLKPDLLWPSLLKSLIFIPVTRSWTKESSYLQFVSNFFKGNLHFYLKFPVITTKYLGIKDNWLIHVNFQFM